jgi:peptidoglycan hydrolase-like protein with peptidoglycan-binding domain
MRPSRGVLGWLRWWWPTAGVASQTQALTAVQSSARTPGSEHPALDRLLTRGDIHIAEARLRDFGFDPGSGDGTFTAQTQAAVRAFQARYRLTISGLLDRETRLPLGPGLDQRRTLEGGLGGT